MKVSMKRRKPAEAAEGAVPPETVKPAGAPLSAEAPAPEPVSGSAPAKCASESVRECTSMLFGGMPVI